MELKKYIESVFETGSKYGLEDMEVYYSKASELTIEVFEGEIDGYQLSRTEGVSFRGKCDGKVGCSYTEHVDEASIAALVRDAAENAGIIDSDDEEELFAGAADYAEVKTYFPDLADVEARDKIAFVKKLEAAALALDERITAVEGCSYGEETGETVLANSKGLYLKDSRNSAYAYVSVVARDGDQLKTAMAYRAGNDFGLFDADEIAREAVDSAVSMLGASEVKSGEYEIIFRNTSFASLLSAFQGIFSAEMVQKNLSLLKGRLGSEIGSGKLTIVDDPFMEGGLASRSFDGEGVPCSFKKVVDKGVLNTYLYNLRTAKKHSTESTGNAGRPSWKSRVTVSPTNFYVEKGGVTYEDLVGSMEHGLVITRMEGLHSGLNAVSGDFSLSASGYEIENGRIKKPVEQITVAGNFYNVMQDVVEIADDLKFGLPHGTYVGSPSVKIRKIAVAGQ